MFQYEMPKVVRVRHKTIGCLYRILHVLILSYFLGFVMWWSKGYQRMDTALSGVMTRVHGVSTSRLLHKRPILYVFDSPEYMLQTNLESGFFVITRISSYTIQHYGECAEARDLEDAHCYKDAHCERGLTGGRSLRSPADKLPVHWIVDVNADAHGIFTGKCRTTMESCEIFGWCPVQEDLDTLHDGRLKIVNQYKYVESGGLENKTITDEYITLYEKGNRGRAFSVDIVEPMLEVLNFTVLIKNSIEFPRFNIARQNILNWMDERYLRTCVYRPNDGKDRFCPNFRIADILDLAQGNKYRFLRYGGTIAITIDWKCDLDLSLDRCLPRYGFIALDGTCSADEGWSVDVAKHIGHSGRNARTPRRVLTKVNGIRFLVRVTGQAGKFNLFIFTMNFGSNLALLSLATYVCDYLLFNCTKDRNRFTRATRALLLQTSDRVTVLSVTRIFQMSVREMKERVN